MNANTCFRVLCLAVVGCASDAEPDEPSTADGGGAGPTPIGASATDGGSGAGAAGDGSSGGGAAGSFAAGGFAGADGSAGGGAFSGAGGSVGGSAGGSTGGAGGRAPASGAFTFLTYNVAGLPEGISQSHPAVNLSQISPLLNAYDVVVVQENFTFADYPQMLRSASTHPYQSTPKPPGGGFDIGDGLNFFSRLFFEDAALYRQTWTVCFGHLTNASDCLTSKGFAVVEVELAENVAVDLYDLHMDAGGAAQDEAARSAQVEQLLAQLATRSLGRAIIVAGDTNMDDNEDPLDRLLVGGELKDSCRALSCGDERIDRVFFRNSATLQLTPSGWRTADEFVDGAGQPLSDHRAVAVDFTWQSL